MIDDGSRRGSSAEEPQIALDGIFELLRNPRRRELLLFLHGRPESTFRVSDVVAHLTSDGSVRLSDNASRESVEITLRHVHLPKLREAGVVTDVEPEDTFRYRPDERLTTWLQYVESETATDTAR